MKRLEFAHALLEKRLTDGCISIEIRETLFGPRDSQSVDLIEPLHDKSAERLIEAVENLAKRIIHTTGKSHAKIITTAMVFSAADIRITVLEFKGI
jgi:exoribonuclease R